MCGIIHVKRSKGTPANKAVIKRYHKQKARGSEGFGFIEIKDGIVHAGKRSENEKDILEALEKSDADEIFFHHRTPTSTPNLIEATHPIVVKNKKLLYNYYVIHNGIIYNDDVLKREHEKQGFVYTTVIKKQFITKKNTYSSEMFNDSESLAIDFVLSLENNVAMKSEGSIAIMVLQVAKKTKKAIALYYGRNTGNPLKIEIQGKGKDTFLGISSESGKELSPNVLYRFDYSTGEITSDAKMIGNLSEPTYKWNGYNGYNGYAGSYEGSYDDYGSLPPTYGYYSEKLGCWVNTAKSGWDDNGYPTDFEFDFDEAVQDLKDEIKDAKKYDDYDSVVALEAELEEMEDRYEQLILDEQAKAKKKQGKFGF